MLVKWLVLPNCFIIIYVRYDLIYLHNMIFK